MKTASRKPRTQARYFAFVALFQFSSVREKPTALLKQAWETEDAACAEENVRQFAAQLTRIAETRLETIDKLLEKTAPKRELHRLPLVDLALLRLGAAELLYVEDVPAPVAINEMVELAKEFGGDASSGFVNAVLHTLQKRRSGIPKQEQETSEWGPADPE